MLLRSLAFAALLWGLGYLTWGIGWSGKGASVALADGASRGGVGGVFRG